MKKRPSTPDLRIKVPPRNQKIKDHPTAIPRPQSSPTRASPRKLREAPLSLSDIPPLRWKKAAPAAPTTPGRQSPSKIPQRARHELRKKSSAPDLRRRNASDSFGNQKSPRRSAGQGTGLKKKSSAPDLRRTAAEHTPGIGDCPPLPRHRVSSQNLRAFGPKDDSPENIPRFMPCSTEGIIRPVRRPVKLPTIIGCTPSRLQVKTVVVPRKVPETRSKKLMRVLKHPNFKSRCKGAAKNVREQRVQMLKRMNNCMNVFRAQSQRKALETNARPIYEFKEKKRASMLLTAPKFPPCIMSELIAFDRAKRGESHVKEPDHGEESEGSVYSEKESKHNDDSAESPSKTGPGSQDASNVTATVNRCGNRIRPSLVPYQDWMEIFESSANPFTDTVSEREAHAENLRDSIENVPDDNTLRASLIPFRDWFALLDSQKDSSNIEDNNEPRRASPSIPSPRNSTFSSPFTSPPFTSPCPSLLPYPHPPSHLCSIQLKDSRRSVKEVKSSDNTHSTVSHCSTVLSSSAGVMSSTSPDPFVAQSTIEGEGLTQLESQVFAYPREEATEESSAQESSTASSEASIQTARQVTIQQNVPGKNMTAAESSKSRTDSGSSKIPRAGTQKRAPAPPVSRRQKGKAAASTSEAQASGHITARKESAEMPKSSQTGSGHSFSGGIRMLERLTGHRNQTATSHAHPDPEPVEPAEQVVEEDDSSSVETWGNFDPEELGRQRPKGLTGEDRIRLSERYGPQLKVSRSAERLLLGNDFDTPGFHASRSLSGSQGEGSMIPKSSRQLSNISHQSGHSRHESETPDSKRDENSPLGTSRDVPNFCRPQVSYEHHPKKHRIITQDAPPYVGAARQNVHPVPRVPSILKSESKGSLESKEPLTPPQGTPEHYEETGTRYPPRSTSLQVKAGSDLTPSQGSSDAALKRRPSSRTFDDIMQEQEQITQGESGARLPDSKSSRMLGGFRSIFSKNKANATGKGQTDNNAKRPQTAPEVTEAGKSGAAAKSKPIWSRSSRTLRVEDISSPIPQVPAPSLMPSPGSYSSIPAPTNRSRSEVYTPSFARPTKATRTRAAASAKQTSVAQEARMHRIKVLTPSTGSPSRSRIHKRSNLGISSPVSQTPGKFADSGEIGIDNVKSYIESICEKACEADDPAVRQRCLRLALNLQDQVSIYKNVDKKTKELEDRLSQMKIDKGVSLSTLMGYYDMVRSELEED